jgi:molybdenum cofactor cytidylyltransferase
MDMGAGGLLAEIPSRPLPREGKGVVPAAPKVTAVVLAAGKSTRMGINKLLADFHGQPMIRATLRQIRLSGVDDVLLVLGHEAGAFDEIANHESVSRWVRNPDYQQGIASSIRKGVEAAGDADAVLICLGDMPLVKSQTIDRLIAAFNPAEHRTIIAPVYAGQLGNPVLWGRAHFPMLLALEGDKGARSLIADHKSEVVEVAVDDPGVLADADTPAALAALRRS